MKRGCRAALAAAATCACVAMSLSAQTPAPTKPRARDLGLPIGGTAGPLDAITDVTGVEVGHTTLISGNGKLVVGKGPIRTGVTVIHPRGKANPDPVVGPELIHELKARLTKPLVGIGGITLDTAPAVIAAGADSVAVISDLYTSDDIAARLRLYLVRLSFESGRSS